MGTRNLTAVVLNGEYKVAQYGQWDGYPSGQGATALNFLRKKTNRQALKEALARCVWVSQEELKATSDRLGIGEWMTDEEAQRFFAVYPYLTRDHGAKILELIANSTRDTIQLSNGIDFVDDSLFCEWAYVIDFDQNTFEVYKGFNKMPLPAGQRFASRPANESIPELDIKTGRLKNEYFPVALVKSYSLDALPTEKKFIKEIEALAYPERAGEASA